MQLIHDVKHMVGITARPFHLLPAILLLEASEKGLAVIPTIQVAASFEVSLKLLSIYISRKLNSQLTYMCTKAFFIYELRKFKNRYFHYCVYKQLQQKDVQNVLN